MPFTSILFMIALIQADTAGTVSNPIPVCDVLENLRAYDGQTIVVRARWVGQLVGDCKPPQSPDDPRYPPPGKFLVDAIWVKMPAGAEYTEPFKTPLQQFDNWWSQGYEEYGTFTGRLQVKKPGGIGFGHLGD